MQTHAPMRPGVLLRVFLSSPILVLILLLAVSAAAEEPPAARADWVMPGLPVLEFAPARLLDAVPHEAGGTRLFGLDLFAMTGSLVDERTHLQSGFALPWGRGPLAVGERALGLAWGWRF